MQQSLLAVDFADIFGNLYESMGFAQGTHWQNYVMILISFVLMYLAIVRKFEPMLLLPIAFGMFLINIPGAEKVLWGVHPEGNNDYDAVEPVTRGLLWYLYFGVDKVIYPPLIFLGIGAMTDFGPLIANPKSMLIGAGAQFGIFIAFILASALGFSAAAAASIAIIGGADGPTAIMVTSKLSSDLVPAIAVAAYSYMALIPIIQKPLMRALTTKKERAIRMKPLRQVSKLEKILFPIIVTLVVGLILPDSITLLGMLMLGNLFKESGVVDRLSTQAQNGLMNTITIFLGVAVGCKAKGELFLSLSTLLIIGIGLFAFILGTVGGLLVAKVMCHVTKGKINPLIGSAGVSAVPMAARISEDMGRKYDPQNHLLMHAMGPNVAGVIGSAIAAGVLLACFG
ncbi:MAG: sodium ion-translocating decarboxylase subunit beta [Clostridia bacterium]|jgi:oxaloacetate decarboxylase beta subunit|nr:sodium ion-translocating decarboxylase subunit beta [Clostridia bacterium]